MSFDWFPRLFVGKNLRILGITVSLGVFVPLKFLFGSNNHGNPPVSAASNNASGTMGAQVLSNTRLAYREPLFIVKSGWFSGDPIAAEYVAERADNQVRVREVSSGKLVDVPREQLRLRNR